MLVKYTDQLRRPRDLVTFEKRTDTPATGGRLGLSLWWWNVSKLLALLQGKDKGYPRPAPSAEWQDGWHGCVRVTENGYAYSDYPMMTEALADQWSAAKVAELLGAKNEA
jgi:hypothetical protein